MQNSLSKIRTTIKRPRVPNRGDSFDLAAGAIQDEDIFRDLLISDLDLKGQSAESVCFESVHLRNIKLREARFERIEISDAHFENCDLANIDCREGVLHRVELIECRLTGCRFVETYLQDIVFQNCNGELAQFQFSTFQAGRFEHCNLREANFQGADLRGVSFIDCDLRNAEMSHAQLEKTDLSSSKIDGLHVNPEALKGLIADPIQAAYFSGLLGITVKWS